MERSFPPFCLSDHLKTTADTAPEQVYARDPEIPAGRKKLQQNGRRAAFPLPVLILFLVIMFFPAFISPALAETIGGLNYDLNAEEHTAAVAENRYYSGDLTIPSSFEYNGTNYSVTTIKSMAFYNCSGLTSLKIGEGVTNIGQQAFSGCGNLTTVTIQGSANGTSIGQMAFYNCTGLTSLKIGEGVTSIGQQAFSGCGSLKTVTIPGSANGTTIGQMAFYNCSDLTSLEIGEGVTSIELQAFYGCGSLKTVTIQGSANGTTIGQMAFLNCTGLTSLEIGEGVTSIGLQAFSGCGSLTTVTIPGSANGTSIEKQAFYNCSGLTSLEIGEGVTSIGLQAFFGCESLKTVTIPGSTNGTTTIGYQAFEKCSGLISVEIGEGVKYIGKMAFQGNFNNGGKINTVKIEGNKTDGTTIDENAFPYQTSLTTLEIGEGVTTIGKYAFLGCTGLTSVVIPASVTDVGEYAFMNDTADLILSPDSDGFSKNAFSLFKGTVYAPADSEFPGTAGSFSDDQIVRYYPLTVSAPEGGTVTPEISGTLEPISTEEDKYYYTGETVTLTVTPDDGKTLKSITVKYSEAGTEKTLTPEQDPSDPNKYTFTMPAGAGTVTAAFDTKYTVTASASGTGVSISGCPESEFSGGTVSFTADPGENFVRVRVQKTGDTAALEALTRDPDTGSFSFTMPAYPVTVSAEAVSDPLTLNSDRYIYNGEDQSDSILTVKDGEKTLTKDTHYTLIFEKVNKADPEIVPAKDAGYYNAVVTGTGTVADNVSYIGTAEKEFRIEQKPVTVTVTATDREFEPGNSNVGISAEIKDGDICTGDEGAVSLPEGITTGTMADDKVGDAKTYTFPDLSLTGNRAFNYKIDPLDIRPVKIDKAAVTPEVTMSETSYTYGGGTVPVPALADGGNPGGGDVTFYYSTDENGTDRKIWENITDTSLKADTYYMFAEVSETESYKAGTSAPVRFVVTPIDEAVVTITGHTSTVIHDGKEHTVSGYDVSISNPLYSESDFIFTGTAEASRTMVGRTYMGLSADQFTNQNPNFANVKFEVTDGYQAINSNPRWEFPVELDEMPKTGFSALRPTPLSARPLSVNYRPTGLTLEIPQLDVSVPVVTVPYTEGEYPVEWLGASAGMLEGSAEPGEGYTILTGHNHLNTTEAGPFALLSQLSEGDMIFVLGRSGNLMPFTVYTSMKISAEDTALLEKIAMRYENSLTLLTCEDEQVGGGYANRFVVAARPAD